jgi:GDP-L-fucose synthase
MNGPFLVNGTGKPQRQFIYSLDLAKLILSLLEMPTSTGSVILSPKEEYSIEYIAKLIAKIMGYEDGVYFDTSLSDGQFKKTADNFKMTTLFPDFTFTPIEEGLKETIEHFITNYKTIRK